MSSLIASPPPDTNDARIPISTLPADILTRIFHQTTNTHTLSPWSDKISLHKDCRDFSPQDLIHARRISIVCLGWRRVILSMTSLWGRLLYIQHIDQQSEFYGTLTPQEVLRRSGTAQLSISVNLSIEGPEDRDSARFLLDTLAKAEYRERIESLSLYLCEFDQQGKSWEELFPLLCRPFPALRYFAMSAYNSQNFRRAYFSYTAPSSSSTDDRLDRRTVLTPRILFGNNAPLLQHFRSHNALIQCTSTTISTNLRELVLENLQWDDPSLETIAPILSALGAVLCSASGRLERLVLKDVLSELTQADNPLESFRNQRQLQSKFIPVSFPNLRSLTIEDHAPFLAALLAFFSPSDLPSLTSLSLTVGVYDSTMFAVNDPSTLPVLLSEFVGTATPFLRTFFEMNKLKVGNMQISHDGTEFGCSTIPVDRSGKVGGYTGAPDPYLDPSSFDWSEPVSYDIWLLYWASGEFSATGLPHHDPNNVQLPNLFTALTSFSESFTHLTHLVIKANLTHLLSLPDLRLPFLRFLSSLKNLRKLSLTLEGLSTILSPLVRPHLESLVGFNFGSPSDQAAFGNLEVIEPTLREKQLGIPEFRVDGSLNQNEVLEEFLNWRLDMGRPIKQVDLTAMHGHEAREREECIGYLEEQWTDGDEGKKYQGLEIVWMSANGNEKVTHVIGKTDWPPDW